MAIDNEGKSSNYMQPATHPGKHGDHPVGGAVGAAVGAAAGAAAVGAIEGAALGTIAGPIGIVAGAGVGGVVGALAGKGIAQAVNPTTEDEYWRDNYAARPYVEPNTPYDTYQPAYRYGIGAFDRYHDRAFEDIEPQLKTDWETARGPSSLDWDQARDPARDAFNRLRNRGSESI